MVRVGVGGDDRVEVGDAERLEAGLDGVPAAAAIDEESLAVDGDQGRVSLADIDEDDLEGVAGGTVRGERGDKDLVRERGVRSLSIVAEG